MSTPNFGLVEMTPAGGQPHLTYNAAIRLIDVIANRGVNSIFVFTAPPNPNVYGVTHVIAANPTGEWAGKYGWIASWQPNQQWAYIDPPIGMMIFDEDTGTLWVYTGISSSFDPWRELV